MGQGTVRIYFEESFSCRVDKYFSIHQILYNMLYDTDLNHVKVQINNCISSADGRYFCMMLTVGKLNQS